MLKKIQNYLYTDNEPNPSTIWKKIGWLLFIFAADQLSVVLFNLGIIVFGNNNLGMGVGLVIALIWIYCLLQLPFRFKANNEPYRYIKKWQNPYAIASINVICIMVANVIWFIIGTKLFNLHQGQLTSQNQQNIMSFTHNSLSLTFILLMAIVVAPIVEEFCFRYLIIGPDKNNHHLIKTKIALAIILFALVHVSSQIAQVIQGQTTIQEWIYYFVVYSIIGADLTYIYYKKRNYKLNILCHGAYNLVAMVIALI